MAFSQGRAVEFSSKCIYNPWWVIRAVVLGSRLSYVPVEMSCVRSRLLFAACAPNRTACGMFRSCSAVGRDRHSCVLESSVRLSGFVGSLRACAFLYGDPDGERRDGGTRRTEGRGERGRRRGVSALLREHIGFEVFSAGSPLGAARPQTCAKETRLPGLSSFDSRRGCALRGEGHSGITKT